MNNSIKQSHIRLTPALLITLCALALYSGCSGKRMDTVGGAHIRVVATTGMVADLARAVAGTRADVTGLMGPGTDPHLYKASQGDIGRLAEADLILYNGLHLEGKMAEVLEKMAAHKPVVAVTDALMRDTLRAPAEFAGQYDPHVWFDVALWSQTVGHVAEALSAIDPAAAASYQANAAAYRDSLTALDTWVREHIAQIPAQRRVLVTAHDAFGYFGRAYDIEVRGLQGISTATEFGLNDITSMVDLLVARRIKAVFVESSVPRRSVEAVVEGCKSRGHAVIIGGELYSDALGPADSPAGRYLGMVRHNVTTIVEALK
ncbi:MAG TPA: zinc ABC transporter substrate-binding protein [candidate division Zixibacteria bacterium]|nr:zinc ABC transporter substrate-binding protein [candidate division Zixibacteria bacterium]